MRPLSIHRAHEVNVSSRSLDDVSAFLDYITDAYPIPRHTEDGLTLGSGLYIPQYAPPFLPEPPFRPIESLLPEFEASASGSVGTTLSYHIEDILERRRQNATRSICNLPTEIISMILLHLRDLSKMYRRGSYAWFFVTHVCHHLRQVALSLPHLWDCIRITNLDMWRSFLARSKDLPLDVSFDHGCSTSWLEEVLSELPRIRTLDLELYDADDELISDQWVGLPAPHLKHLRVERNECQGEHCLMDLLLLGDRPLLKTLSVYNFDWYWMYGPLPRTLTSFSVTTLAHCMRNPTRMRETLSTLRALPLLKSLSIWQNQVDETFEWDNSEEPDDSEDLSVSTQLEATVPLPQLKYIELQGVFSLCYLLDRLSIPPECQKSLRITVDVDITERFEELATLLNRNFFTTAMQTQPFVELCIQDIGDHDESNDLDLQLFRTERSEPFPRPGYRPLDEISFKFPLEPDPNLSWLSWRVALYDVVGRLDLSSVRTLELFPLDGADMLDYRKVLHRMPNIQTVRVHRWCLRPLCSVLQTFLEDDPATRSQIFLPRLRDLMLSEIRFPPLFETDEESALQAEESLPDLDWQEWFSWLPATRLCHHLREIALASAQLWAYIIPANDDMLDVFLARSRGVPIDVVFADGAMQWMLQTVLKQLPRLRSLYFEVNWGIRTVSEDAAWIRLPAPHLKKIYVSDADSLCEVELITLLLDRHMPSMSALNISRPAWRWMDTPLPSTLTQLWLSMQIPWMNTPSRAKRALAVLRDLPLLETLYIEENDDDDEEEPEEDSGIVAVLPIAPLPKLKSFSFIGGLWACLRLLERISIPHECKQRLHMRVGTELDVNEDIEKIRAFFNRKAFRDLLAPLARLAVRGAHEYSLCSPVFEFMKISLPFPDYDPSAWNVNIRFERLVLLEDMLEWRQRVYNIIYDLKITSVRTLDLYPPYPFDGESADLRRIMTQMPNIERLHMTRGSLRWFVAFVTTLDGADGEVLQVFLPNLRELLLHDFDLAGSEDVDEDNQSPALTLFLDWLRERHERGISLKTLVLDECKIPSVDWLQALSMHVEEEISLDGCELIDAEEEGTEENDEDVEECNEESGEDVEGHSDE
ncbi:hypothetical protein EIP86_005750 [Pleurotus ostreatoroseus]|nr:hypothetical protein EIP86_005750 [Pleurotus ostreatoroseus]